jgi:hypothetical protein
LVQVQFEMLKTKVEQCLTPADDDSFLTSALLLLFIATR